MKGITVHTIARVPKLKITCFAITVKIELIRTRPFVKMVETVSNYPVKEAHQFHYQSHVAFNFINN